METKAEYNTQPKGENTMTTELQTIQESRSMTDRMTPMQIKADHNLILQVMEAVMQKGMDYGLVPGCGNKPTLLKPGCEKLMMTFGLSSKPIIEDLSDSDSVRYRVTTEITHAPSGVAYGYGVGEASSNEEKYKWKKAICDEEYELTREDHRRIKFMRDYKSGQIIKIKQVRTNPADIANTILKMADKRSVVSGVLKATAASSIFTQDLEDLSDDVREAVAEANEGTMPQAVVMPKAKAPEPAKQEAPQAVAKPSPKDIDKSNFRSMTSKFGGECLLCGGQIEKGSMIYYDPDKKRAYHKGCVGVGQ